MKEFAAEIAAMTAASRVGHLVEEVEAVPQRGIDFATAQRLDGEALLCDLAAFTAPLLSAALLAPVIGIVPALFVGGAARIAE
mgnify:CR=1 FL=1